MYKRILVPIDGSSASRRGLQEALSLAKQNKARIQLLHVVGIFIATPALAGDRYVDDIPKTLHAAGTAILKKATALVRRQRIAVDIAMLDIAKGRAADAIVGQAKQWRADLIVIGTHGRRGFDRLALGSDAEKVVRTSPVPVLVVGPAKTSRR
jgi:nucleotide-binding universal stress UspA family protein